jgi:hypothetical protein
VLTRLFGDQGLLRLNIWRAGNWRRRWLKRERTGDRREGSMEGGRFKVRDRFELRRGVRRILPVL